MSSTLTSDAQCVKAPQCSWCQLPVPLLNQIVFGCETGRSCRANFEGVGAKPITDVAVCTQPVKSLNLTALVAATTNATRIASNFGNSNAAAPPVDQAGRFLPPPPNSCPNLSDKCLAQCPNVRAPPRARSR